MLSSSSRGSPHTLRQQDSIVNQLNTTASADRWEFSNFRSRPDIVAPRWNLRIHHQDALAAGYWFVATYGELDQHKANNRSWIGPYIFDRTGELVWSGSPISGGYNVKDFKVSNVDGVQMLTGIYARKGVEIVLTSSYELHKVVPIEPGSDIDIHHFDTVDDGRRSVAMTHRPAWASQKEAASVGCNSSYALFSGFEERDTKTWNLTFEWNAEGHIALNESLVTTDCASMNDFLHANSIDKFRDGDYLLSARHTDTLYKISGKDGTIVWRLGGKHSDFDLANLHFSGQHDARIRAQNEKSIIISILDNAIRPGIPHITNSQSRGMIIALHTDDLTAKVVGIFNHPHGKHAEGRGNLQYLENSNVLRGWWRYSLISEHAADGTLLCEASWRPDFNSYRSYKFEWVGRPTVPPDVYAEAVLAGTTFRTDVCVSWNGATEVHTWILYKTNSDGEERQQINITSRQGFETLLSYNGFAGYVTVEAKDHQGNTLGQSIVAETVELDESLPLDQDERIHEQVAALTRTEWSSLSPKRVDLMLAGCVITTCVVITLILKLFRGSRRWIVRAKWRNMRAPKH